MFSDPELATVGLSEEQAIQRHGEDGVVVHRARFRSMARALPASGPRCLLKLVVEKATDRVNLTPVAIDEGRAFADSVFGSRQRQVNHGLVASAVFSDPELATVGLSEEQAIERHGADGVVVHRARFRSCLLYTSDAADE